MAFAALRGAMAWRLAGVRGTLALMPRPNGRVKIVTVNRPQQPSVLDQPPAELDDAAGDVDELGSVLDELDLEEELKRSNPKGRLFEQCQKLHVAPPEIRHRAIGRGHEQSHQVELTLLVDEWELSSGIHTAHSRRMAEQLAARDLLATLEEVLAERRARAAPAERVAVVEADDGEAFEVDDAEAERLQRDNPKGRLFEWCAQRKIALPRLEARTVGGVPEVRASILTLDLVSPWFRAARRKGAEQAAAAALLPLLPDVDPRRAQLELDPRSALTSLQQRGEIAAYRIELEERGPVQARTFTAIGHLTTKDGASHVTEPFEAPSKKAATLLAARELVARARGDAEAVSK